MSEIQQVLKPLYQEKSEAILQWLAAVEQALYASNEEEYALLLAI